MAIQERLGITLPDGLPLSDAIDVCAEAGRLGYTDVWSSEVGGYDAFTPLAAVAARVPDVRLGTGVVPAATRPPALLAMTAVTLQELSGGRFVLGLGTSTATIVNRWMGVEFPPGLARMRETIEAIRAVSAGGKVSIEGSTVSVKGFRLEVAPAPVPIFVGALGPRMIELAGAIADGLVLTMVAAAHVPTILDRFFAAATAAGRDPEALDVVLACGVVLDEPDALELVRESIAAYGVIDVYNRHLARQGFEDEARAFSEAWARRSRPDALAAVTDRMVRGLSICGDVAACRGQIAEFHRAGVKTLLLAPVTRAADRAARREKFVRTLAAMAPRP